MKSKYSILTLITLLTTLGLGSLFFLSQFMNTKEHLTIQEHQHEKHLYTCPMHPQIKSEKPGTCPICGMDLVPVEESNVQDHEDIKNKEDSTDQNHDHSKIPEGHTPFKLKLNKQQMIGIRLDKVKKKPLFKTIHSPGRIAFDPELYTAQSEYLEALKQWNQVKSSPLSEVKENTRQMIRSSKIRLKVLGLSEDQISNLAKKGSQSEGLLVSGKGQDNWIYADVFEVDLPYIKKGLSAQITANFLQGKTLAGKVISVDQVISPDSRTAKVRIQLLENHPSIRPESYVNVSIFAPLGEHTSIPLNSILDTGRETFVFIRKNENEFEPRKVTVLLETDDDAAVGPQVHPGEEIVVGGNFMLDSESRLKSVIQDNNKSSDGLKH